uniref:Uncharacterized protein n=1 Tax=Anguilla anguilla TaxID=7936 RepID=A0A0E9TNC6_ANGAN
MSKIKYIFLLEYPCRFLDIKKIKKNLSPEIECCNGREGSRGLDEMALDVFSNCLLIGQSFLFLRK